MIVLMSYPVPPAHASSPARVRERGFSVVEVVIAVIVLAIVASAIGIASVSGLKSRSSSRVQASLTSAGEQIQEDLATDREWMSRADCTVVDVPCNLASQVAAKSLALGDVRGRAELLYARSTALDSSADGIGADDRDGVTPDYYRLEISIRPTADVRARYGLTGQKQGERRFVTTLDRRGIEQVGSVGVAMCQVVNQVDERMQVQGCRKTGRTDIRMNPCVAGSRIGCDPAFNWVAGLAANSGDDPSPFVSLSMLPKGAIGFTLVSVSDPSKTYSSRSAAYDNATGMYVFANVPSGEYRLTGIPDSWNGMERWRSKELPTFHGSPSSPASGATIAVEAGVRARALVLFRPNVSTGIDLHFQRVTSTRTLNRASAHVVYIPDSAPVPTTTYQGSNAAKFCEASRASIRYDPNGSVFPEHFAVCISLSQSAPNCLTVNGLEWGFFASPTGTYVSVAIHSGARGYSSEPDAVAAYKANGLYSKTVLPGIIKMYEFCTFYSEQHDHTYYAASGPVPKLREGAAKSATYYLEAKPDNRHVEYPVGAAVSAPSVTTPQCIVSGPSFSTGHAEAGGSGQCQGMSNPKQSALASGLKAGLNSSLAVAEADAGAKLTNGQISHGGSGGLPGWVQAPLWVRTNNSITSAAGGTRSGGSLRETLVGKGECYWRNPAKYPGELQGYCDPCAPIWQDGWGGSGGGACSLLTHTTIVRPVWEEYVDFYNSAGYKMGPYEVDRITSSQDYPNPLRCTSIPPRIGDGGTCRKPELGSGGGAKIAGSSYTSSATGGVGVTGDTATGADKG